MAITYYIEDQAGVVFTRLQGVIGIRDVIDHQLRLGMDELFNPDGYELINTHDCRPGDGMDFRSFLRIDPTSPWGGNARRAIVTSSPLIYGLANIFAVVMSKSHGDIAVFRSMEHAQIWLGIDMPEGRRG